nr:hypothetical protein [Tanacetum cinerariifolium]
MGRDTIQLENAVSTISQEYLLEFTSEYGIPESLHPELSGQRTLLWSSLRARTRGTGIAGVSGGRLVGVVGYGGVEQYVFGRFSPYFRVKTRAMMSPGGSIVASLKNVNGFLAMNTPPDDLIRTDFEQEGVVPKLAKSKNHVVLELPQKETMLSVSRKNVHLSPFSRAHFDEGSLIERDGRRLGFNTLFGEKERGFFLEKMGHRSGYLRKILYESSIETGMTKKTTDTLNGSGMRSFRRTPVAEDPDSEKSTSFMSMLGSPGSIYQPRWGVTSNCRLETPAVCQEVVDHIVPQEALLEAKADMKVAADAKNAELVRELESLRVQFLDLQVSNDQLSQQVSNLQAQILGKERIKAAFEEFKKYKDDRVTSQCAEIDARLDALSIYFDEELYPHMLTAIVFSDVVSARVAKGISEGLKHEVEHRKCKVDLAAIEAYDPEADTKYVVALYALKDLKYSLVDQLEKLKDAPIDMICELHPISSQPKFPVYPEVRNPKDAWSFKEEILLEDIIVANISRVEKKKKCWVVCRTYGVGSANHVRSDGVPVSVPTVAPQGLAILLADVATQTDRTEDEASSRLLRSKSVPPMYNFDWPQSFPLWTKLPSIHGMATIITMIDKVSRPESNTSDPSIVVLYHLDLALASRIVTRSRLSSSISKFSRSSSSLCTASTIAVRYDGILISA